MRDATIKLVALGFFVDTYNLWVVDIARNVMAETNPLSAHASRTLSGASLAGVVVGMVIAGLAADVWGRRKVYLASLCVLLLGSFGSVTASGDTVFEQFAVWRALLGVGIGAEYPLSATIVSEHSAVSSRGHALALVFMTQGIARLVAAVFMFILLKTPIGTDTSWRIALLLGCIPYLCLIPFRRRLAETPLFLQSRKGHGPSSMKPAPASAVADPGTASGTQAVPDTPTSLHTMWSGNDPSNHNDTTIHVVRFADGRQQQLATRNAEDATALASAIPEASSGGAILLIESVSQRCRAILSTLLSYRRDFGLACGSWFLLDVYFYGQGLWSSKVLVLIGFGDFEESAEHTRDEVASFSLGLLVIALIALPGYVIAVSTIERMGRRRMQILGFCMSAVCFFILGVGGTQLQTSHFGVPFLLVFGLTFFFANWGPNTTTFVISAELFPTRSRATAHGFAAAAGKLGAIVGTSMIPTVLHAFDSDGNSQRGVAVAMYLCAAVAGLGALLSWGVMKETSNIALDSTYAVQPAGAASHGGHSTPTAEDDGYTGIDPHRVMAGHPSLASDL